MGKKIKILYTIPNFDTAGSGQVVYDLVKHIDTDQFEPHIACNHTKGAFFKNVQDLGVPIHIVEVTTPYRPYRTLAMRVWKKARFFRTHQFDVIHSWHWSSDVTEPLAAKLAGIPFVYTKKAMGWGNKAWQWRSRLSSHIITINSDMLDFFKGLEHKISEIPIGIDPHRYKPLEKSTISPNGTQIKTSDFCIVSVANLVPVKGVEVLLEAVNRINDETIKVFIVGDNTSAYGQALTTKYTSKQVAFRGKVRDVRPYLAMADLFVIPTLDEGRREGQPIAPLEAMLCERLVLGSKVSGIRDILKPFPEYLVEASNVKALAEKITALSQMTREDRQRIAQAMQRYAQTNYALTDSILQHQKVYKKLVAQ